MDGPTGVTQCPIGPGETFTHVFTIAQTGTYWYHSHNRGQYPDGFRGPILIHDPASPYAGQYDQELVLTLSDWYHKQMPDMIPGFLSTTENPSGAEPVPNSAIINDNATTSFAITPGKTYMVRIINMSNFASFFVKFDQHEMTIIEVDGVYTVGQKTDLGYLSNAQRMSVLITAKSTAAENFAFVGAMDPTMFDTVPPTLNLNATGYLIYDTAKPLPSKAPTFASYDNGLGLDDFGLIPYDKQPLFKPVTRQVVLNINSGVTDNQNRFTINNSTYVEPKVPSLYTAMSVGKDATNPIVYGHATNPQILDYFDTVEVVVNNYDSGGHPLHLHGHHFQIVQRSAANAGTYSGTLTNAPATPIRRDVVKVNAGGYVVFRFIADNPGVWAWHCHIDWHLIAGFFVTFIEAPLQLQSQNVPADQYQVCKDQGLPYMGNAAANTENFTNLNGANNVPPPIHDQGALT
ncbi:putative ferrooxidoreductase Fet3 [Usnea florida]